MLDNKSRNIRFPHVSNQKEFTAVDIINCLANQLQNEQLQRNKLFSLTTGECVRQVREVDNCKSSSGNLLRHCHQPLQKSGYIMDR